MKNISTYITEKLKITDNKPAYNYSPKMWIEIKNLIHDLIENRGDEADLNDIDVSHMVSLNELFWNRCFKT